MEKDITEKRVWNTKQVYWAITTTGVIVFFATIIWTRFLSVEKNSLTDKKETHLMIETIDKRYRKITDRIINRLDVLEEPNSDK